MKKQIMVENIKIRSKTLTSIAKIFLILILILTPMIILWVYGGELNFNQENWLVAEYGKKWGLLKDDTMGFGINDGSAIIQWMPFVIALSILVFATLVFIILVLTKIIEINFYSIVFSTWFMLFVILITGLLSSQPGNDGEIWKIFVRLICVILSFPLSFFIINPILVKIILHSSTAVTYAKKIINDEKIAQTYIKSDITDLKPKTSKKKITEIEVEE